MLEAYNYVRWRNNCLPDDIEPPFINEVAEGQPGKFVSHPDQPLPEEDVHEMVWYAEWYGNLIDHILKESKVSGSFRAQARKILKPFLALAYNALINHGVHVFGYLIDTRRDANGMSASSIWGNTPDFHEVHAKHRIDIQAQTFDFEAMFRMVEMAQRGRDIPPLYVSVLHEMNDMTRSKSGRDRGHRIMGRIVHAKIKMLTGKECSWNNLRNAASLQLRLCNWPANVPFPGLPGGPKECRKGDYDEFLPAKEKWIRELLDGKISAEQQRTPSCVYFEHWTEGFCSLILIDFALPLIVEEKTMSHEDQESVAIVRMVDGTDYVYARDSESWVTGTEVHSDDEEAEDATKAKKAKRSAGGVKKSKKAGDKNSEAASDNPNPATAKRKAAAKPVPSLPVDVFDDDVNGGATHGRPKGKGNRELPVPNLDDDPRLDSTVPLQDIEDALFQAASALDEDPSYDESSCYELLGSYLRPGTAAYRAWVGHFVKISKSRSMSLSTVPDKRLNDDDGSGLDAEPTVVQDDVGDNEEHHLASAHETLVVLHDTICNGDKHIGDAYHMLDSLLDPGSVVYAVWKDHFNALNETGDDDAVPDPPDILLQIFDTQDDTRTPTPPPITFDEHPTVQLRRLFPKINLSKHVTTNCHVTKKPAQSGPSDIAAKALPRHTTPMLDKSRPIVPLPARALTRPIQVARRPPSMPPAAGPSKVIKPTMPLRQVLVGSSSTQPPSQVSLQRPGPASKRPVPEPAYIGAPGYKGPTDYFDTALPSARGGPVKRRRLNGNTAGNSSSKQK
ncbi:hypothetical protein VNI00_017953 [Paramarasmius palmivorus]|uniref:Uncharacterized protein n=1 Tax=Paramarasmius palmivorus TaxID=297713 RepID=A0AAW0B1H4_9AGAR